MAAAAERAVEYLTIVAMPGYHARRVFRPVARRYVKISMGASLLSIVAVPCADSRLVNIRISSASQRKKFSILLLLIIVAFFTSSASIYFSHCVAQAGRIYRWRHARI